MKKCVIRPFLPSVLSYFFPFFHSFKCIMTHFIRLIHLFSCFVIIFPFFLHTDIFSWPFPQHHVPAFFLQLFVPKSSLKHFHNYILIPATEATYLTQYHTRTYNTYVPTRIYTSAYTYTPRLAQAYPKQYPHPLTCNIADTHSRLYEHKQ